MKTKCSPILLVSIILALFTSSCTSAQVTTESTQQPATSKPKATNTKPPTVTPTKVPTPTEVPRVLSVDVTKPYAEWDMSGFTAEQQAMIDRAVNDPDHASRQDKDFYDQVVSEGIAQLTGDPRYAEPFAYDIRQALTEINHYNDTISPSSEARQVIQEANARLANFAEFLSINGIHEISAPLPFSWYLVNISITDNYPLINDGANPGYMIEGYGTNPDTRTGFAENVTGLTRELMDLRLKGREGVGQNKTRDMAFGEPIFVVYPDSARARGDLLALVNIAGENADTAQLALIRTWNASGQARYALLRLQYADETIQSGDNSCLKIPLTKSSVCPPGTVLKGGVISQWDDYPRRSKVDASREKMLELMAMTSFTHPIRLTLQAWAYNDEGAYHSSIFMDGVNVVWDIKVPTIDPAAHPDFFK